MSLGGDDPIEPLFGRLRTHCAGILESQ